MLPTSVEKIYIQILTYPESIDAKEYFDVWFSVVLLYTYVFMFLF